MKKINGFIVAPFTPMHADGSVNYGMIDKYADFVHRNGMDGVFVCGSSGEGALLTIDERMAIAERWVKVAGDRLKVIVHTGCVAVIEQKKLAAHAQKIGAWGIGSMAPSFLPPRRNQELVAYCREIAAAAPELPFYYYHIPALSGVNLSVIDLLKAVDGVIPNFAGVKYTADNMLEQAQCKYIAGGKYEILHGLDETLLSALAFGLNDGGVGGTYNHCFSLYKGMKEAFEQGDLAKARELQHKSHEFINVLCAFRGNIVVGKKMMKFMGVDCGPNRLPMQTITDEEEVKVKEALEKIGFFEYCNK